MSENERFKRECEAESMRQGQDDGLREMSRKWMDAANAHKYSYHFEWLGRPMIQYPQDIVAMQEIIWNVKPELIVETGIAHGGSLIFYASMLELVAACGGGEGMVVGIDVEIRRHNREAIEAHPMFKRITMIEGSSVSPDIVRQVKAIADGRRPVLVVLDSNHTHEHVMAELDSYADLVTLDSYCVVFDTVIEYLPADSFPDRPWSRGNNPMTAVSAWLNQHPEFRIDRSIQDKLLITVAPEGFLRRIR